MLAIFLACFNADQASDAGPSLSNEPPSFDESAYPPLAQDAPTRIAAQHILFHYQDSVGANQDLKRTRQQAFDIAQSQLQLLREGADFTSTAIALSDGPSGPRGGHLYAFEQDVMHFVFDRTAFSLEVNGISDVVETPFGFHIIKRLPLEEIRVSHVLVQWAGLPRTNITRSESDARALIEAAEKRLVAGASIADIAAEYSDGATGKRGGDLGWFQRGQLNPAFDDAAFALAVGERSPIIESPIGYHIIYRTD